jgi:hypothetical protein
MFQKKMFHTNFTKNYFIQISQIDRKVSLYTNRFDNEIKKPGKDMLV